MCECGDKTCKEYTDGTLHEHPVKMRVSPSAALICRVLCGLATKCIHTQMPSDHDMYML